MQPVFNEQPCAKFAIAVLAGFHENRHMPILKAATVHNGPFKEQMSFFIFGLVCGHLARKAPVGRRNILPRVIRGKLDAVLGIDVG